MKIWAVSVVKKGILCKLSLYKCKKKAELEFTHLVEQSNVENDDVQLLIIPLEK